MRRYYIWHRIFSFGLNNIARLVASKCKGDAKTLWLQSSFRTSALNKRITLGRVTSSVGMKTNDESLVFSFLSFFKGLQRDRVPRFGSKWRCRSEPPWYVKKEKYFWVWSRRARRPMTSAAVELLRWLFVSSGSSLSAAPVTPRV